MNRNSVRGRIVNRNSALVTYDLTMVRDWLIAHLQDLRKQEVEGELFETLSTINPLLKFFHKIMEEVNPPKGFSDPLLEFIFRQPNLCLETGFMFAKWASYNYREKIWRRSLRFGSFSETEKLFQLIDRRPTLREIKILVEKTRGIEEECKKVVLLAQKYYPHNMDELTGLGREAKRCL